MATKAKPLPYRHKFAIDEAKAEIAEAVRALRPLIDGQPTTREDIYQRLAKAIYHSLQAKERLETIRTKQE